jgi:hypothetical protein
MNLRIERACLVVMLAVQVAGMMPAQAGGPLYVTGLAATQPGTPYRWNINPIPYWTDLGGLGNQTNAQANAIVSGAFQAWQGVSTANISFQNAGQLPNDITEANIMAFQDQIGNCSDTTQPTNSIVYDLDGTVMTALGYDNNSVIGFAGAVCTDDVNGYYTRGWAVLNGRFIDGQPDTASHATVPVNLFQTAIIHEFGHLIGLDHSQVNLNCLTSTCSALDLAGVPTMFPVLLDVSQASPRVDDQAELSSLYPAATFSSTTGRIQGHVLFSDGETPAQGYNVIARMVSDPRRTAVSCVSGFLYTAGAGNPLVPGVGNDTNLFYGSRDQTLIGYYDIPGLPPGNYTIEVEALNDSGTQPFVNGSGVGPIGSYLGFQYKMPGTCQLQYLNVPSSPSDSCSAKSTVTVGAGSIVTNTDVIFLGTPPRYDAWENGP